MTRKNNGKITRRDSRMTTPPEIPQWLLAAFDVVLTIEEIGQDNGAEEIEAEETP